jgi:hypothetical protein
MYKGIEISTPNIFGWTNSNLNNSITSNKFDRVFNGLTLDGFNDATLGIGGNTLAIEDDCVTGGLPFALPCGRVISAQNNNGKLVVGTNTLQEMNGAAQTNSVSLVYKCSDFGLGPSKVLCNSTSLSYDGFQFNSKSPNTNRQRNRMCNHSAGLALGNSAVSGKQGTPALSSDNYWDWTGSCSPW